MPLFKSNLIKYLFVLSFALMQMLQPFNHVHLDGNEAGKLHGFHLGSEHEELLSHPHVSLDDGADQHRHAHNAHAVHTIFAQADIKPGLDAAMGLGMAGLLLFAVLLTFALPVLGQVFAEPPPRFYTSSRYTLPATRAPPQR